MDERSKALQLIRLKGPIVPSNISKDIDKNILFTSVILAELVSAKQLKVSKLKIGSSPLYYLPGQESRLENFYKYLNEKDRRTFDLLKKERVLRESEQDPLVRVSLASIKDFAVPLEVTIDGKKELFWKWHSLGNDEASDIIRNIVSKKGEMTEEREAEPREQAAAELPEAPEIPAEKKVIEPVKPIEKEIEKPAEPQKPKKVEKPKEILKPVKKIEKPPEAAEGKISDFVEEIPDDQFFKEVKSFFDKNDIEIVSFEIVRKNREIDFTVNVTSKIGKLLHFCRAKRKKRVSDSDIASAFVQSQVKNLPLIFITPGVPTKKTLKMLEEEFVSVTYVQI